MIRAGDAVGIVGGGMLGLTLALRLAEAGAHVSVLEAAPSLGGLAAPWSISTPEGDVGWDRYYHVTLESDAELRALLADLDLDRDVHWTTTRTGYLADGRLAPLSTPRDFLALPSLSWWAKARLAATLARGTTVRDWRRLERMTVEQWLTRWSGRDTFRRFWIPLLEAKLGSAWTEANAAFIWATIRRLTAARRAGIGDERFGAVAGGYGRVLEVLEQRLVGLGATVRVATAVDEVRAVDGGVSIRSARGDATYDHVVVTTTPRVAAALLPSAPDAVRDRMLAVRSQGVVCASLVLDRPLSPYYLTYLMDDLPFTAVVEMTAVIPPAWLGGHALVYLPRYCAPDSGWFDRSDEDIAATMLAGLEQVHPGSGAAVVAVRVARSREVFPLPRLRYSETVPAMDVGVPGVSLVSSAQIVNGTLNVNETVALAGRALRALTGGVAAGP